MSTSHKSFIDVVRSHPTGNTTLKSQPWWEVGDGWRVHLGLDQYFCLAWNRYTGEVTSWCDLIPEIYPETLNGDWLRLVTDALAHGKRNPDPF